MEEIDKKVKEYKDILCELRKETEKFIKRRKNENISSDDMIDDIFDTNLKYHERSFDLRVKYSEIILLYENKFKELEKKLKGER